MRCGTALTASLVLLLALGSPAVAQRSPLQTRRTRRPKPSPSPSLRPRSRPSRKLRPAPQPTRVRGDARRREDRAARADHHDHAERCHSDRQFHGAARQGSDRLSRRRFRRTSAVDLRRSFRAMSDL